jgi:hypothetical protein
VPPDFTIAVTAIVRRDLAAQLRAELAEFRPDARFDPVVHDFFEDARLTLNGRADLNQPFGVPLAVTVVPADTTPVVPTPGPLPTGGPSPTPTAPGFITQTPTSGPPGPVYPTPGPITGDS